MESKYKPSTKSINNLSDKLSYKYANPDDFIKELDLFLCNTSLPKIDQDRLIEIINKLLN